MAAPVIYHAAPSITWDADGRYRPESLAREGFIHASYADKIEESIALYLAHAKDVTILQIDPARLDVPLEIAETPRGPMPHIMGPIPRAAVVASVARDGLAALLHTT